MSARILVLGATGTTESLTVKKLIEERIPVSIGGRDTGKLQTYSQKYDIESLTIDIGNKDQLKKRFEKYDVIMGRVGPW